MIEIPKGSIEYIAVRVGDRLGNLTNLAATGPKYEIREADTDNVILPWTNALVDGDDGMLLLCLVDTQNYAPMLYHLYTEHTAVPETIRLGPFRFKVTD